MVNVSFVCREQKKNRFGSAPIEMTVNTNGKRTFIALDIRCKPEDFKDVLNGGGDTHILEYITACRKKIDTLIVEYTKAGREITAEGLKMGFKTVAKTYTLDDMFTEFLALQKRKVGKGMVYDTYRRYERSRDLFYELTKLIPGQPASDVNFSHIMTFQTDIVSKMDSTTARNYLQKIKSVFKFAFETGKIPANPAYGMKIQKVEKDTVMYLTQDELNLIKKHKFGKRLQEIADCFLFSCYTGLSFSDIVELEKEDFKTERSIVYVSKKRKKTGIIFTAVIFEDALEIAQKYNYKLPLKTNQKTNEYLKEIGDICGIEKSLKFHMARHTAACYYINHRPALPDETIQRIFGWTNAKQLHHYAKLFNTTVFNDVEKAFAAEQMSKSGNPEIPEEDLEFFKKELGI